MTLQPFCHHPSFCPRYSSCPGQASLWLYLAGSLVSGLCNWEETRHVIPKAAKRCPAKEALLQAQAAKWEPACTGTETRSWRGSKSSCPRVHALPSHLAVFATLGTPKSCQGERKLPLVASMWLPVHRGCITYRPLIYMHGERLWPKAGKMPAISVAEKSSPIA